MAREGAGKTGALDAPHKSRFNGIITGGLLLAGSILIITFVCRLIISHGFGVPLDAQFWYRDYMGNLVVTLILAILVQSARKSLLPAGALIVLWQLCNALKLTILGTPASPDDFFNIKNVFFLTEGWRRIALMLIAAIPFLLTIALFPWRRASAWLALLLLGLAGLVVAQNSEPLRVALDRQFGNSVWNQPANYRQRGLALHLFQETMRTASKVDKPPQSDEVRIALNTLTGTSDGHASTGLTTHGAPSTSDAAPTRNVHVFVLESFFDPMLLGEEWVPEDPLPADFRELWAATDYTTALSPVFGAIRLMQSLKCCAASPSRAMLFFLKAGLDKLHPACHAK